ncbi:MAG: DUF4386 domain-containing protein [Actinomycetota bacterium]|nr:DUF4386 domain-containing protein [Actinomycetota bacterium]
MAKLLDRVADAGGFLFVLLVGVGFAVLVAPFLPESLDSPEAVADHLAARPPTAALWAGVWLEAAGLAALVLLAARLAGRIRAVDPAGWVPSAVVGLAVAAFTVKIASFAPAMAALEPGRHDAGTVTALLGINYAAVDLAWALDGAFVLLLGLGALDTRALPRWLGAWTAGAGVAVLIGVAVPATFGLLQLVFLLWAPAASGWLLLRGGRTPAGRQGEVTTASPAR